MSYLWESDISESDYKKYENILSKSIHRYDDRRIKHLANWVLKSTNTEYTEKFIIENINCKNFYPFANPWVSNEIDEIFKQTKGTKLVRFSTRDAGKLTLSNINGISHSQRIDINPDGIKFGNYVFKTIYDLISHIDKSDCCICLENISDQTSTALKCGHIFHIVCLDAYSDHSNLCPFCKIETKKSFVIPQGNTSVYQMMFIH